MIAARHFRRCHRHDCAGNMAVTAARHVTTRRVNRNGFLTRNQSWNNFMFNIAYRGFLRLCKPAHILMGELNIFFQLLWHQCAGGGNFFLREDNIAIVFIKFLRVFERFCIAAVFNIVQYPSNNIMDVGRIGLCGKRCFFQVVSCHSYFALFIDIWKHCC